MTPKEFFNSVHRLDNSQSRGSLLCFSWSTASKDKILQTILRRMKDWERAINSSLDSAVENDPDYYRIQITSLCLEVVSQFQEEITYDSQKKQYVSSKPSPAPIIKLIIDWLGDRLQDQPSQVFRRVTNNSNRVAINVNEQNENNNNEEVEGLKLQLEKTIQDNTALVSQHKEQTLKLIQLIIQQKLQFLNLDDEVLRYLLTHHAVNLLLFIKQEFSQVNNIFGINISIFEFYLHLLEIIKKQMTNQAAVYEKELESILTFHAHGFNKLVQQEVVPSLDFVKTCYERCQKIATLLDLSSLRLTDITSDYKKFSRAYSNLKRAEVNTYQLLIAKVLSLLGIYYSLSQDTTESNKALPVYRMGAYNACIQDIKKLLGNRSHVFLTTINQLSEVQSSNVFEESRGALYDGLLMIQQMLFVCVDGNSQTLDEQTMILYQQRIEIIGKIIYKKDLIIWKDLVRGDLFEKDHFSLLKVIKDFSNNLKNLNEDKHFLMETSLQNLCGITQTCVTEIIADLANLKRDTKILGEQVTFTKGMQICRSIFGVANAVAKANVGEINLGEAGDKLLNYMNTLMQGIQACVDKVKSSEGVTDYDMAFINTFTLNIEYRCLYAAIMNFKNWDSKWGDAHKTLSSTCKKTFRSVRSALSELQGIFQEISNENFTKYKRDAKCLYEIILYFGDQDQLKRIEESYLLLAKNTSYFDFKRALEKPKPQDSMSGVTPAYSAKPEDNANQLIAPPVTNLANVSIN